MQLARAIHFDESDLNVFHCPARTGEWCLSGGFEFSNWSKGDLTGKARQAFANGWLGLETFGRVTFVAVTQIEETEYNDQIEALASWDQQRLAFHTARQASDFCLPHPPRVVGNGFDLARYRFRQEARGPLGWAGRVAPEKGLEDLMAPSISTVSYTHLTLPTTPYV